MFAKRMTKRLSLAIKFVNCFIYYVYLSSNFPEMQMKLRFDTNGTKFSVRIHSVNTECCPRQHFHPFGDYVPSATTAGRNFDIYAA